MATPCRSPAVPTDGSAIVLVVVPHANASVEPERCMFTSVTQTHVHARLGFLYVH
eukprot:m.1558530 g.1558530  ORF g.1558530 m.1558530 type:complete len:55 (-) comp25273_c0_seq66:7395-7559(-)